MRIPILTILAGLAILLSVGCKKHNDPAPDPGKDSTQTKAIPSHCVLIRENIASINTAYTGNWQYEYDSKGVPMTLTRFDTLGSVIGEVDITAQQIVDWRGKPTYLSDFKGDLFSGLPSSQDVTLNYSGTITPHISKYTFSYDSKGRLTSFVDIYATTYTLAYDDSDNVTKMSYNSDAADGAITVTAYDNKPSPYTSAKKVWKFIQHNFNWASSDPESMMAAISRNNPLKLTVYGQNKQTNKASVEKEINSYQYADTGYPIQNVVTHVNEDGSAFFYSRYTYTYDCK